MTRVAIAMAVVLTAFMAPAAGRIASAQEGATPDTPASPSSRDAGDPREAEGGADDAAPPSASSQGGPGPAAGGARSEERRASEDARGSEQRSAAADERRRDAGSATTSPNPGAPEPRAPSPAADEGSPPSRPAEAPPEAPTRPEDTGGETPLGAAASESDGSDSDRSKRDPSEADRSERAPTKAAGRRTPPPARESPSPSSARDAWSRDADGETQVVPVPVPIPGSTSERARHLQPPPVARPVEADDGFLTEELEELASIFDGDRSGLALGSLFVLLALLIFVAVVVRRARESLAREGWLPTLLVVVHLLLRLGALLVGVSLIVRVLPPRLSLIAMLTFAGFSVAVGWSARELLSDLVAGFVLAFERRVRRGMWIATGGIAGQVEQLGFRSTQIRDAQGRQVSLPNRHLLGVPVTSDGGPDREHEVVVVIDSPEAPGRIREALRDAVLSSPWVYPGSTPVVLRDPADPHRWLVRGRLLEARFGGRFEGDLSERAEAFLTHGVSWRV